MVHFLGFMLSISVLELSIKLSINRSAYACIKLLSKVCGKWCHEALAYASDNAHILLNFACTILLCVWCVISIVFKMTHDQLASYPQRSMKNM